MASNNYTKPTISGYNATPPADDGTHVAANQLIWATIKTKLADPIKVYLDALLTNAAAAFATLEAGRYTATEYTTAGADTHTFQTWCNRATLILVGAGGAGFNDVGVAASGGGGGAVKFKWIKDVKTISGTATLQIGNEAAASGHADRNTTYSDSTGLSLSCEGGYDASATHTPGGGGLVGGADNSDVSFEGSTGLVGDTGKDNSGRGGGTFFHGFSVVTTGKGSGGHGSNSAVAGINGASGYILVLEYE